MSTSDVLVIHVCIHSKNAQNVWVRGWRKIGRVNAYLLPRKPVSERVNNDDIPKSRTVQFFKYIFLRICNL